MTEDQIERKVEQKMNRADAMLLSGKLSPREYDNEVKAINTWADGQYDWERYFDHGNIS